MKIDLENQNLKTGVLGLVLALVEIIRDALNLQALKRMESGDLTDLELERLGKALMDLDQAIEQIKTEHDLNQAVQNVRDGLDDLVDEMLDKIVNPERWEENERTLSLLH